MTTTGWIIGSAILALLDGATNPQAARADLDNAIRLGRVHARCGSRVVKRRVGGDQILDGCPIASKLWARARTALPGDAVWRSATLSLPATDKEQEITLIAVEFDERQVRDVLIRHGVAALAPMPVPKEPYKRSGGHNMAAHGAVISAMTIELLNRPLHEVLGLTVSELAKRLGERFDAFKEKREAIGRENRERMAQHLRANVIAELERRQAASRAQVVQVAAA